MNDFQQPVSTEVNQPIDLATALSTSLDTAGHKFTSSMDQMAASVSDGPEHHIKPSTALDLTGQDAKSFDYWLQDLVDRAEDGDVSAAEKLFNYYATEQSNKTARDWTAQREDTAYQRLMVDLRKAGISPYILSGATPAVSSASGSSHSGSQMTSRDTNELNFGKGIITGLLTLIGKIIMGMAILG